MFRTLAYAALLLSLTVAARADVYRWVDANGHVQYSDRWVPGSELVKVDKSKQNPQATASRQATEQSKLTASNAAIADREAQANAVRTVQQDLAKARDEQCKQATERYDKAMQARRIYRDSKDGKREYISDTEADAYRAQLLLDKQGACGPRAK